MTIYTIGHSTRPTSEIVTMLKLHGVVALADVRRFPGSRRSPQFSRDRLREDLAREGIGYFHLESLGGRRKAVAGSPNGFWRNEAFRGYADHMATAEFNEAMGELTALSGPVAVMCAEAVPWKCHRNMIADELTRRGIGVVHILAPTSAREHTLNAAASDTGTHLIYPESEQKTLFQ
ncbi:MAG: DUF488 domain-containing protein [Acidobacteriota bacterium]